MSFSILSVTIMPQIFKCIWLATGSPLFEVLSSSTLLFADLVLKDKIFVYDLARQRIGWTNYDCKFASIFLSCYHIYDAFLFLNFKLLSRFHVCKCLCDYKQGWIRQRGTAACKQLTDTHSRQVATSGYRSPFCAHNSLYGVPVFVI